MWRQALALGHGQHHVPRSCVHISRQDRRPARNSPITSLFFCLCLLGERRRFSAYETAPESKGKRRAPGRNGARAGLPDGSSTPFDEWLKANPLPDMAPENRVPDRPALGKLESYRAEKASGGSGIDGGAMSRFQRPKRFSWKETGDLLYESLCEVDELRWDCELGRFFEVNPPPGQPPVEFMPPLLQLPPSSGCTPHRYLQILQERSVSGQNKQLLALLSSSAAAMGIFKDGSLLAHKVITAYTVRAKQGKSQLKYLRQGGPGRMTVGGAIRANESMRFFSRVCEKFEDWAKEIEDCETLFSSGTTRVWNEVYGADPTMRVPRDDERWHKIPFNVHEPRFLEMQRVFYRLGHGWLCNARW